MCHIITSLSLPSHGRVFFIKSIALLCSAAESCDFAAVAIVPYSASKTSTFLCLYVRDVSRVHFHLAHKTLPHFIGGAIYAHTHTYDTNKNAQPAQISCTTYAHIKLVHVCACTRIYIEHDDTCTNKRTTLTSGRTHKLSTLRVCMRVCVSVCTRTRKHTRCRPARRLLHESIRGPACLR